MVPDPWAVLAETDLALCADVVMPEMGRYYHRQRVIFLRRGLLVVEQRATLWHELVHARRGDTGCSEAYFDAKQEISVDREAARWAMPTADLLEAFQAVRSYAEVADTLKTTDRLLKVRLRSLHPSERAALTRLRESLEEAA